MPSARLDRFRIVLVATSLPANIGAAARAMLTMGLTRLVLVAPRSFPHPDATALAAGATGVLDAARIVATLDEALAGVTHSVALTARPRQFAGTVLPLRTAATRAVAAAGAGEVALVFGTEMSGLTNEQVLRCAEVATIAANPGYASLNLAAAVQVAAWEVRMAAEGGAVAPARRFAAASHDEVEALYAHALATLAAIGFYDPRRPRRLMTRLRRLFARTSLEREEVNILRGILARVDERCAQRAPSVRESTAAPEPARRCANCGAEATWNFCPNCGQETAIALPPAFAFLRDAAGRYVRFDGRTWRTLALLLFRPGFLTREYLAGRRRRYVRPARLFVVLSIVLFAVMRFQAGTPTIRSIDGSEPQAVAEIATARGAGEGMAIHIDPKLDLQLDLGGLPALAPLQSRVDAFNRLPRDVKAEQVVSGMFRYAPYAAIGLLPLFALFVAAAYAGRAPPGRPRRYAAHLVFGAHNHAFLFALATLFVLSPPGPLRPLLAGWALVYALVSQRRVYGGSWPATVLRAIAIAAAYLACFALAVAALLVAAVLLR